MSELIHLKLGNELLEQKKYEECIVAYDKAININPSNALAW